MDISKIQFGPRFELTLPGEEVDDNGKEQIVTLLAKRYQQFYTDTHNERLTAAKARSLVIAQFPEDWTWRWFVPNGKFAGNLPKRLQSFGYKRLGGLKLEPKLVEEIGNIAKKNSTEQTTLYFDFTDDLNWERGLFGDGASCFHVGDMHMQRLEALGCIAMRVYDGPKGRGLGRMWLYPWSGDVKKPQPEGEPYGFLGFNAYGTFRRDYQQQLNDEGQTKTYGQLQTLDYSRVLAQFLGVTYTHVHVAAMGKTGNDGPMFFNNEGKSACLIAPIDAITPYKPKRDDEDNLKPVKIDLAWTDRLFEKLLPVCSICGTGLSKHPNRYQRAFGQVPNYDRPVCVNCVKENFAPCAICNGLHLLRKMTRYATPLGDVRYCEAHANQHIFKCGRCGGKAHLLSAHRVLTRSEKTKRLHMITLCNRCYRPDLVLDCTTCDKHFEHNFDERLTKQIPEELVVQCPRCAARKKKLQPADPDEEIDPAELVYEEPEAVPAVYASIFHQLAAMIDQDDDNPILLQFEQMVGANEVLPVQTHPGQGWGQLAYWPGMGAAFVSNSAGYRELVESAGLGEDVVEWVNFADDGTLPHTLLHSTALAVFLPLPPDIGRKAINDPVMKRSGNWKFDQRENAVIFQLRNGYLREPVLAEEQYIGPLGLRALLLASPTLFASLSRLLHEQPDDYRRIRRVIWNRGQVLFLDANDQTLLRGIAVELTPPKEKLELRMGQMKAKAGGGNNQFIYMPANAEPVRLMPPAGFPYEFMEQGGGLYPNTLTNIRIVVDTLNVPVPPGVTFSPSRQEWLVYGDMIHNQALGLRVINRIQTGPAPEDANGPLWVPPTWNLDDQEVRLLLNSYRRMYDALLLHPRGADLSVWRFVQAAPGDVAHFYITVGLPNADQLSLKFAVMRNGNCALIERH